MTLTVRLDSAVEAALERHCAERGMTKSAVVQESLAKYLWSKNDSTSKATAGKRVVSPTFEAFQQAGLVGSGELNGASAGKAAVRARALQRIRRAKAA
jgi:predicted transcriptional regulator